MYFLYECAACVIVAAIVSMLAVLACTIFTLLNAGRGSMGRKVHQLMEGAPWQQDKRLVVRVREP